MFGLTDLGEVTHLAAEPGAGATTMLLQLSRLSLKNGGRVLWLSRVMPDGLRMTQIFSKIDTTAVARFHAGAFGDALDIGILNGINMVKSLPSLSIVLVDNWSGTTGQPSKKINEAIKNLIGVCRSENTSIILSSTMYGDATGESLWKIRGQGFMNNIGAVEWKLQRGDGMRRTIEIDNKTTELSLTDDGFQKR
jgi:hypothetical protein